jgi:hypothetical protein
MGGSGNLCLIQHQYHTRPQNLQVTCI